MKTSVIFRVLLLALGLTESVPARGETDEQVAAPAPAVTPAAPTTPAAAAASPAAPASFTASTAPAASTSPAASRAATTAAAGPSELVRRRCKVAGAVLLGVAGVTVLGFFGSLIYSAVASPDSVSLAAGPRLGFGLSALGLGIAGSALLGYSVNAPGGAIAPRTPPAAPVPPRAAALAPDLPAAAVASQISGSGSGAALELRF